MVDGAGEQMQKFTIANWHVDPDRNLLSRDGRQVRLEPKVMDLLVYLAERPGEVLSRDQIFRDVWSSVYTGDAALQTAISNLRKALDDDPRKPTFIATVPKRGYRLIAESSAPKPAIAVLPFDSLSDDPDDMFFTDGMSDALIAELGKVRGLRVISRQSTMAWRGSKQSLPVIAKTLGAGLIVEGSAVLSGGKARVTVQLIDAGDDLHLLSETYERPLTDVITLYRETAVAIVRSISGRLRLEAGPPAPASEVHPDALVAYLRGRFCWYKMTADQFQAALRYFEQAVQIDPDYAAAHAGIADVLGAFAYWGVVPPGEVKERIRAAVERAEGIDSNSAEVQMLAGAYTFHYEHDWAHAEDRFRRATELNPNLAHARLLYGLYLSTMDRPQAIDEFDLAARIDPLNPAAYLGRAMWLSAHERYDEARQCLAQIFEIDAHHPPALQVLADLDWLENAGHALATEARAWQMDPELSAQFTQGAGDHRPRDRLLAAARTLETRAGEHYVQPRQIARLLVHAGDLSGALDCLERALDADDLMQIDFLQLSPAFNPLRSHPRFRALLDRLSLP